MLPGIKRSELHWCRKVCFSSPTAVSNNSPSGCLHFFLVYFLLFLVFFFARFRGKKSEKMETFLFVSKRRSLFICRWKSFSLTHVCKVICSEAASHPFFSSHTGGIRSMKYLNKIVTFGIDGAHSLHSAFAMFRRGWFVVIVVVYPRQ